MAIKFEPTKQFASASLALVLTAPTSVLGDQSGHPPITPEPTDQSIEAMQFRATLDTSATPISYSVRYNGASRAFDGRVCYWFEGYNETCLTFEVGRLTRATELKLTAPGGVPVELLRGYTLNLRLPGLSTKVLRLPVVR